MDRTSRLPVEDMSPRTGLKRSAPVPALLPAFEPFSSSPPLPRPAKRVARDPSLLNSPTQNASDRRYMARTQYPTPVPTSSTGIISSSPPPLPLTRSRPNLQRAVSALSERAPLASVPSIELDPTGEETLLGRSGRSANYQLSTSKLISRVHVRAAYVPANPPNAAYVELVCTGWNGMKVHCQGKAWDLKKDDSFKSESCDVDIMVDVQDARVLLVWPKAAKAITTPADSDSGGDGENSPRRPVVTSVRRANPTSPLQQRVRLQSPVSPTPKSNTNNVLPAGLFAPPASVQTQVKIYEDPISDVDVSESHAATQPTQSTQRLTQPLGASIDLAQSDEEGELSDRDEENDPLVHSFGPFGANILPRMASFTTADSPKNKRKRDPAGESEAVQDLLRVRQNDNTTSIINHVINQLAFSRLSSTPLSTIMSHLPSELKADYAKFNRSEQMTLTVIKSLVDRTDCVGEVTRQGKDAAGKKLESEYYYIPESDFDESRRDAVVSSLRKPGLRNCRKQHKQYYWRKPK